MITETSKQVQGRALVTFTLTKGDMEATFSPSHGMTLLSLRKGPVEIIDQTTRPLFEERSSGLGPLIGPHFHHRLEGIIPGVPHPERFPHLASLKAKGNVEPFSHGVARYAPWKAEAGTHDFSAQLIATEEWNGVSLEELEGQNFTMWLKGDLDGTSLRLHLSITSDTESVVGFHYYYALPQGKGRIVARVQNEYRDVQGYVHIPSSWDYDEQQLLTVSLGEQPVDFGFQPYPNQLQGHILLDTLTHALHVSYECANEQNSWQLWHPENASFVCIEPLSAQNPRQPSLSVSSLIMRIQPELH